MGALKIKVNGSYVTIRRGPRGPSGALTGEMKIWPSANLPTDYLWCDGAAVSRTQYASLFAELGTVWGAGDGSTTFNLPDMRLRVPVGAGTGRGLGSTDGLAENARLVKWSHSHAHTASGSSSTSISGGISGAPTGVYTTATDTNHNHSGPPDHPTGPNPGGSGNTRLGPAAGHGSTSLVVQAGGISHAHGIGDPWHSHGHTIGATTSTTVTVNNSDTGDHPTAAVNYIIKT